MLQAAVDYVFNYNRLRINFQRNWERRIQWMLLTIYNSINYITKLFILSENANSAWSSASEVLVRRQEIYSQFTMDRKKQAKVNE